MSTSASIAVSPTNGIEIPKYSSPVVSKEISHRTGRFRVHAFLPADVQEYVLSSQREHNGLCETEN
jgi:hypothetical protein